MNKYLEKIAEMSDDTKNDLKATGKVMAAGSVAGGVGMGINKMLKLDAPKLSKGTSLIVNPSRASKALSMARSAVKPRNLAAAGVLGLVGGVGDYLAIRHSHNKE